MPQIQEQVSLKPYNTFGIDVRARYFTEVKTEQEVAEMAGNPLLKEVPYLILGGGSNLLFTEDYPGMVIKNNLKGIELVSENEDHATIKAASGEIWHHLVLHCIAHGYGGVENLSLIPGTVGAAPIQNIGAYGVELKEVFQSLEAIDMASGEKKVFTLNDCEFGYRDSVFKHWAKGKYFITSVVLRLSKKPVLNLKYGAIEKTIHEMGIEVLDIAAVSRAVCHIRSTKLPDPASLGNAGSFFKNPEIEKLLYDKLLEKFPDMPGYATGEHKIKVPAGWLIENRGWKGKIVGHTGSHKDQALVLVNYGGATGREIRALAYDIQRSVKEAFGIEILPEVNVL